MELGLRMRLLKKTLKKTINSIKDWDGVAAAAEPARVPTAAVGQALSTSHHATLQSSGFPQHTLFASSTGPTINAHHCTCSMLDTKSLVFLALADAL